MSFTIKDLNDMVAALDREHRPSDYRIAMSLKGIIHFDTCIGLSQIRGRFFFTDTEKAYDWIEITPYSKGNLWKIRCLHNKTFQVYYGTVKKAYCTTLQDALNLVNNNDLPHRIYH